MTVKLYPFWYGVPYPTKDWIFNFEDETPQGWKVGHPDCCQTPYCQGVKNPHIYNLGRPFPPIQGFSIQCGVKTAPIETHTYGTAMLFDFTHYNYVSLSYWAFRMCPYDPVFLIDIYDYPTGDLLVHKEDHTPICDEWHHIGYILSSELAGHKVCWVFSKGYGSLYALWDDIHIHAEDVWG